MANVMGIWGGLVGPKSGNVEKVLVFKAFLKGSRGPRGFQDEIITEWAGASGRGFLLKNALCRYSELCLLPTRGVHF